MRAKVLSGVLVGTFLPPDTVRAGLPRRSARRRVFGGRYSVFGNSVVRPVALVLLVALAPRSPQANSDYD